MAKVIVYFQVFLKIIWYSFLHQARDQLVTVTLSPQNIGARITQGKQNICRQEEDSLDMEIASIQENCHTGWVTRKISELSAEIPVAKSSRRFTAI